MTTNVQRVDHVAIAVADLRPAVALFTGVFGAEFIHGGDDPRIDIRTVQLRMPPGIKIELMTPTSPDSYLQAFIDKRGQGFHHMTVFVDDVVQTIDDLTAAGVETVDTDLTHTAWRETFLRPSQGFGLIQVIDTDADWSTPATDYTLEDVLEGKVVWQDHVTRKDPAS